MNAFLKAFKDEQFGGDLGGREGVSLLFLALVVVGRMICMLVGWI